MTGLEKMVSQILEEADASAAVTISDAEKKAAEILREAGEKADKIRQQREEQSRAKVKSYEERTASAADMKKRTAVLAAKQSKSSYRECGKIFCIYLCHFNFLLKIFSVYGCPSRSTISSDSCWQFGKMFSRNRYPRNF